MSPGPKSTMRARNSSSTSFTFSSSDAIRSLRMAEVVVLLVDATHPLEHQDLTIADMAPPRHVQASTATRLTPIRSPIFL